VPAGATIGFRRPTYVRRPDRSSGQVRFAGRGARVVSACDEPLAMTKRATAADDERSTTCRRGRPLPVQVACQEQLSVMQRGAMRSRDGRPKSQRLPVDLESLRGLTQRRGVRRNRVVRWNPSRSNLVAAPRPLCEIARRSAISLTWPSGGFITACGHADVASMLAHWWDVPRRKCCCATQFRPTRPAPSRPSPSRQKTCRAG
jgi:hypothetical protein